ncbi:hypothetical protein R84B8_02093 [Treponema sp. R8-4-B8]
MNNLFLNPIFWILYIVFFIICILIGIFYRRNKKKLEQEKLDKEKLDKEQYEKQLKEIKEKPISDFLKENKLEQYCEIFEKNKIENVESAISLSDTDLSNIGISMLGDRKKILSLLKDVSSPATKEGTLSSVNADGVKCPKCGSSDIQAISEVEGKTKGFGCCSGAIGAILLGPIGWLCGLCGMNKGKITSKTMWVCKNCGNKFH